MKISIPTKQLVAILATLKPIAKPSTTHAIIGNVCITTGKDSITILGMDLEKQLSVTIACKVTRQGSTTIPCTKLHDSLSKVRGLECVIETTPTHETTIRVGNAVKKILGLGPDEMPQQISMNGGISVIIPAATLNSMLGKSLVHASVDKSQPLMQSVTALSRRGKLNFQATNYKRAVICDTGIDFETPLNMFYIIPRDSVPMLLSLATDGDVELTLSEDSLTAKTESCTFATKLIEGRMPEYETGFPKERPLKIIANREELIGIVEYAEVETSEVASHVLLSCDGSKITVRGQGKITDDKKDSFMEMNEDEIVVMKDKDGRASDSISLKLNPQYLREALKCMAEDEVTLQLVDERTPVVIEEPGVRCAVCPIRLA